MPEHEELETDEELVSEENLENEEEEQASETDSEQETETSENADEEEEEEFDEIIYNKETVKIPKTQRKELLEKGYNYDKMKGKYSDAEAKLSEFAELTGMSTDDALNYLRQKKQDVQISEYAQANDVTEDEARIEMRIRNIEQRDFFRDFDSQARDEMTSLKNRPFFEDLKEDISNMVEGSKKKGDLITPKVAYTYLRGEKMEELLEKEKSRAVKSTVADIHDRSKRGVVKTDTSTDDDIDASDVDLEMTSSFGNDPKAVAKHKRKFLKRK